MGTKKADILILNNDNNNKKKRKWFDQYKIARN